MSAERTNADRALRIFLALAGAGYTEGLGVIAITDNSTMAHQAVKDLLCDVRHFCDRTDVDYALADSSGYRSYSTEVFEDPTGTWPPEPAPAPDEPDYENDVDRALWFTPAAIRDHFEGETTAIAAKVAAATDEQLAEVGEIALGLDGIYREFHEALEEGASILPEPPASVPGPPTRGEHETASDYELRCEAYIAEHGR